MMQSWVASKSKESVSLKVSYDLLLKSNLIFSGGNIKFPRDIKYQITRETSSLVLLRTSKLISEMLLGFY